MGLAPYGADTIPLEQVTRDSSERMALPSSPLVTGRVGVFLFGLGLKNLGSNCVPVPKFTGITR